MKELISILFSFFCSVCAKKKRLTIKKKHVKFICILNMIVCLLMYKLTVPLVYKQRRVLRTGHKIYLLFLTWGQETKKNYILQVRNQTEIII